ALVDLCHVLDHLWKSFKVILRQIKPVHGLGETQVGVDTGNDNACIDREQLDAYKGYTHVDIDHQALVQDGVDDISEAAGRGGERDSAAGSSGAAGEAGD